MVLDKHIFKTKSCFIFPNDAISIVKEVLFSYTDFKHEHNHQFIQHSFQKILWRKNLV